MFGSGNERYLDQGQAAIDAFRSKLSSQFREASCSPDVFLSCISCERYKMTCLNFTPVGTIHVTTRSQSGRLVNMCRD